MPIGPGVASRKARCLIWIDPHCLVTICYTVVCGEYAVAEYLLANFNGSYLGDEGR